MSRTTIAISLMLTLAPLTTSATLVVLDPSRWGGSINPAAIIMMAFFGLFSTPLWPTYIPALVLVPWLMRFIARRRLFVVLPVPALIVISFVVGAIAGAFVLIRLIWLARAEPTMARNWAIAGAVAGSVTFTAIVLVFRVGTKGKPPPLAHDVRDPANVTQTLKS